MLTGLGCSPIPAEEPALRLARQCAQHLLTTNEDPLPSIPYFYRLLRMDGYPEELMELGYFDENTFANPGEERASARESLQELLSPELRQRRIAERKAAWERERETAKKEWPYILNSPTGRALLMARYKERLIELRPLLWIELVGWISLG